MSLSVWEQQMLAFIERGLAESDPELTSFLTAFTRVASGEQMPTTEKIMALPWSRMPPLPRRRRRSRRVRHRLGQACRRLGFRWVALSLWLAVTISLISIALFLSHGAQGGTSCSGPWGTVCTTPPAHPASGQGAAGHATPSGATVTPAGATTTGTP